MMRRGEELMRRGAESLEMFGFVEVARQRAHAGLHWNVILTGGPSHERGEGFADMVSEMTAAYLRETVEHEPIHTLLARPDGEEREESDLVRTRGWEERHAILMRSRRIMTVPRPPSRPLELDLDEFTRYEARTLLGDTEEERRRTVARIRAKRAKNRHRYEHINIAFKRGVHPEDAEIRAIVKGRRAARSVQRHRARRRHQPKQQRRSHASARNPRRSQHQAKGRRAGASYRSSGQH